jgi:excisionase family DNA binding protein
VPEEGRPEQGLIDSSEAARLLACTRQRVHQLVKKGVLAGTYKRKRLYVALDQVMARREALQRESRLLTIREAAERLGVAERQVYRWERAGRLASVRTSTRRILFDPAVLDAFVKPPRRPQDIRHERPYKR